MTSIDPADFQTSPGLRRLTRAEYVSSVLDLFGAAVSRDDLPKELIIAGHSQIAGAQKTGYDDVNAFADIGDQVAVVAGPKLAMQLTCAAGDAACLRKWASDLLLRVFRAPPAAPLLDRYVAILSSADAGDNLSERVTTFVSAALSSPQFLYKKEIGTAAVAGDATSRTLDGYEIATRLAYLAWQAGPDAALLAAAASGGLAQPATRAAQLDRLLADPRAARGSRTFVGDWMGLFENNLSKKAPEILAGTGSDFPTAAARAFDLLVDDVLAAPGAKLTDLLKVDYAYANAPIAKVLGSTSTPADFQKITVDPKQHLGVLTQPMVIGAHSKESGASPFPIGKFIYENVLCDTVPPPPASFPPVMDSATSDLTLRQQLEAKTANEPCHTCHSRIGPPGFSFLPYDPVGRYKATDAKGRPFDTTGALLLAGGATVPFDGAADLSSKLATQPAVQKCLARRYFRWTYGRFEGPTDTAPMTALETATVGSGTAVADLLHQLVSAPGFAQVRVR
jgi:hypothetical protein